MWVVSILSTSVIFILWKTQVQTGGVTIAVKHHYLCVSLSEIWLEPHLHTFEKKRIDSYLLWRLFISKGISCCGHLKRSLAFDSTFLEYSLYLSIYCSWLILLITLNNVNLIPNITTHYTYAHNIERIGRLTFLTIFLNRCINDFLMLVTYMVTWIIEVFYFFLILRLYIMWRWNLVNLSIDCLLSLGMFLSHIFPLFK